MALLEAVPDSIDREGPARLFIDREGTARLFIDRMFRQYGLPLENISDRDPRFTGKFWKSIFKVLGTRLEISTADNPQTEGQIERVNRMIGEILPELR